MTIILCNFTTVLITNHILNINHIKINKKVLQLKCLVYNLLIKCECTSISSPVRPSVRPSVRYKTVSFFPIYSKTVHFFNVLLLFKVVYLLILHNVRPWPTAYYSVLSTTESTVCYFPTYSQVVQFIKFTKLFTN